MVDIILGGESEILRSKCVRGHCSVEIAVDVHSFSWVKTKQFFIEIKPNKSEYYVEPGETPKNLAIYCRDLRFRPTEIGVAFNGMKFMMRVI